MALAGSALCCTGGKADKHCPPLPAAWMPRPLWTATGEQAGRLQSQTSQKPRPLAARDRREPVWGSGHSTAAGGGHHNPPAALATGPSVPDPAATRGRTRLYTTPQHPTPWLEASAPSLQATSCLHMAQPASSCLTHQFPLTKTLPDRPHCWSAAAQGLIPRMNPAP